MALTFGESLAAFAPFEPFLCATARDLDGAAFLVLEAGFRAGSAAVGRFRCSARSKASISVRLNFTLVLPKARARAILSRACSTRRSSFSFKINSRVSEPTPYSSLSEKSVYPSGACSERLWRARPEPKSIPVKRNSSEANLFVSKLLSNPTPLKAPSSLSSTSSNLSS